MKGLLLFPSLLALSATAPLAGAQSSMRCGLPPRADRPGPPLPEAPSDCGYFSTNIEPEYEPSHVYDVPVVFHVIQHTSGAGYVGPETILDQIDVLNEDFQALSGSPGEPGVDARIRFHLATQDPSGGPTTGITYTTNDTWYQDDGAYWNALAWDTNRYMNVYTNSASGYFGYVPDWPQGGIVGQDLDRIVVWWEAVGKDPTPGWPLNQGRTLTHETGHYLGLDHPFVGGCAPAAGCYANGDLICDTNPQSTETLGCPGSKSTCGSPDAIHNYMDYTDDPCLWEFTGEQVNRMRCTIEHWRPDLAFACAGVAASVLRNGGANPVSLAASAPSVGGTLALEVDLTTTGHAQALPIGFESPLDLALGGGQHLLVNLADPGGELLALPLENGPLATWDLPVPYDACGFELSVQAIHVGGVTPFGLSNARDLTIGP